MSNVVWGTKIRQVQGTEVVEKWSNVLLQVDGADGKQTIRLDETLIIPGISVNLFSLQRVLDMGYLPVYVEVPKKCVIKKVGADGTLTQVATMTIVKGRSTLDCDPTTSPLRTSGPAPLIDILKLDMCGCPH